MAAPTLQAHTMRRGNETKLGCGGVPLAQFMVVSDGGSAITSWAFTQTSGTTGHWTLTTTSSGTSPKPTSAGVAAFLNGGPYVWNVTATNADGTSSAAVLTINIAANTITVATKDEISGTGPTGLRYPATLAGLGGKTVEVARGSYAAFNGNGGTTYNVSSFSPSIQKANTHSERFSITSEDRTEGNRSKLGRLTFGGCQRVDVFDLDFEGYLLPQTSVFTPPKSENQGTAMLVVQYVDASTGMCDDMTFDGLRFYAPEGTTPDQWRSAMQVTGQSSSPFAKQTNISITNCTFERVLDGLVISNSDDISVGTTTPGRDGVSVDTFCSNAIYVSGYSCSRVKIRNSVVVRPFHNTASPTDHRDSIQIGSRVSPGADYNDNCVEYSYFIMANGDTGCQGVPYCDDVAYSGGVTGDTQNNFRMRNVFTDAVANQGGRIDGGTGVDVLYYTMVRGYCTDEANDSDGVGIPLVGMSSVVNVSGVYQDSIVNGRTPTVLTRFPTFDADNCVLSTKATMPDQPVWTEAERIAYMAGTFQDPGRVIDHENLSAWEIVDEIEIAYAPLLNGFARKTNGAYHGFLFPDGSFNDGSIYGAEGGPTAYTLTSPQTTVEVGVAITLNLLLDAPAEAGGIDFTWDVTGVTGSFSEAVTTIAEGQVAASATFTPESAGTAAFTAPDDAGLPNPTWPSVTVTEPAVVPTTYTFVATRATVSLGGQVPLLIELDEPAVAPVNFTFVVVGGYVTPSTVQIATGQSTAALAFVPEILGVATITPSDDQGLTDPVSATIEVVVGVCTTGALLKYGIKRLALA